jgi:hypothetical protein
MMRRDVTSAIGQTREHVQHQLQLGCGASLELLNTHLPQDEPVESITTAAAPAHTSPILDCLLVLTGRRLLFVAPTPRVVSWRLPTITQVHATDGVVDIYDTGGGQHQLCVDTAQGPDFASRVRAAVAVAILRDRATDR